MKFAKPIFFGIIASFGALFLELLLSFFWSNPDEIKNIFLGEITALLIAAVMIEEAFKFIFVLKIFQEFEIGRKDSAETDRPEKYFFRESLLVGLGFSFLELLFAFFNSSFGQSFPNFALAASGLVMVHILTAGIIGYSMLKFKAVNLVSAATALAVAFFVHFSYNLLIIYFA